jgi:hypothetical protein
MDHARLGGARNTAASLGGGLLPEIARGPTDRLFAALRAEVGDAHDAHAGRKLAPRVDSVAIRLGAKLNSGSAILRDGNRDPPLARWVENLDVEVLVRPAPPLMAIHGLPGLSLTAPRALRHEPCSSS